MKNNKSSDVMQVSDETQSVSMNDLAFEKLLEVTRDHLLRTALYRTRNANEAEDVVQTACFKAWRSRSSFRGEAQFATWMTSILRNEIAALGRDKHFGRLEYHEELTILETKLAKNSSMAWPENPEEQLLRAERNWRFRKLVKTLPKPLKAVLLLELEDEKCSNQSAAKRLNTTIAAVKSRKHRARAMVRQKLTLEIK